MALGTKLPVVIISKIIPIISKKIETISKLSELISTNVNNLRPDVKCTDPEIVNLKVQLDRFQKLVDQLNSILSQVGNVTNVLRTVATIAKGLSIIQLAIPPIVPAGPIAFAINTFTKLIDNTSGAVIVLNNVITNINSQFNRINSLIADAVNALSAICHTEVFEVSAEVAGLINDPSRVTNASGFTNGSGVTTNGSQYDSEFYSEINVSDIDIQYRFDLINDLIADELNVLDTLIEAPSDVLIGEIPPKNATGNINSYYIDTTSNIIYGPKTVTGWGTGINL
jgi:hypothetical protein